MEIAFLIGRIVLGGYFLISAVNHYTKTDMLAGYAQMRGVHAGRGAVLFSGLFLVLGGLGVLLGVWTDIALALLIIFLVAVSIRIHHFWTDTDPNQKMSEMINFTQNMALIGALLMLYMVPNWPYSL